MKCKDKNCPYRDRPFGCQHTTCVANSKNGKNGWCKRFELNKERTTKCQHVMNKR